MSPRRKTGELRLARTMGGKFLKFSHVPERGLTKFQLPAGLSNVGAWFMSKLLCSMLSNGITISKQVTITGNVMKF